VAAADSRQIASKSQFLGVQFASVVLLGLLVGVERRAADSAVDVSTTTFDDLRATSSHYRLVFAGRTLQRIAITDMNSLYKCRTVSTART